MKIKKKIGIGTGMLVGLIAIGFLSWWLGSSVTTLTGIPIYITSFFLPVGTSILTAILWVISWAWIE